MKRILGWFWGRGKADYRIGADLFCRGIGLIYLIAILSWWVQAELLVGENGLVPAAQLLDYLDQQWEKSGTGSRWNLPTLFWITGASDPAIHSFCAIGCLLGLLVILGLGQGPALVGLWLIYLSLVTTGDVFMSFQWDILLLESGILAILLSSWRWRERWRDPPPLNLRRWIALGLAWFVIAKLMFLSGWVKLAWASPAQPEWWPDHTAMTFHFETQPIPTWSAWFVHQFPVSYHKLSIWPMYFIELILPFFVFLAFRLRAMAGLGFCFLMLLILLTGNYTYFNWLTIALCVPLIADRFWPQKWIRGCLEKPEPTKEGWKKWLPFGVAAPILLFLMLLNYQVVTTSLHRAPHPLLQTDLSPKWLDNFAAKLSPFNLASSYGLFRTMTTERPEIIVQGSADGVTWKSYDFKWKPDRFDERPRFVAPHQPRVAWQLWFAALEGRFDPRNSRNARWFQSLMIKLLKGDPSVQALFSENPFPEKPPKFLRARLQLFEFTNFTERKSSGNWWKSSDAGEYLPQIRLP